MDRQPPLKPYFDQMPTIGGKLTQEEKESLAHNFQSIKDVEAQLAKEEKRVQEAGVPTERIHQRGQLTVYDRLEYLVDPGTWRPLHSLYNPMDNVEGCTGVVNGLGKIRGKWAVIIAFNNKILAGAWIPGQADNILRTTELAKKLNIPLVWVLNCSGVKLTEQEKVFPNRRGNGATFYRHAELNRLGIPVLNAIYGTNPAGGGYHGISPTILLAHKDANIAVGGAGIVGGLNFQGDFSLENVQELIEGTKNFRGKAPGRVETHFGETGFFREVHETEEGVLDGIKRYMDMLPAYDPEFFRVAEPAPPKMDPKELDYLVPADTGARYDALELVARITDNSEFMEYRPDYGPEVFTGVGKIDGFPVGIVGNRQIELGEEYPDYAQGAYSGTGDKLYRQGLIKMSEFITFCSRDNLPVIWLQDTSGLDVGDAAEKAELLGLGQSLVYSIGKTDLPMICIVVRRGMVAGHYVMGGPPANNHNAFTLGTPLTEIAVMPGETAAAAAYSRRLVKEQEGEGNLQPLIDQMNEMVADYRQQSDPIYGAIHGFVDEVVSLPKLRDYCVAFAGAAYQNPNSITPVHQMLLPRSIKG